MFEKVKVLAFDADDTLWENEPFFRDGERAWAEAMSEYGSFEQLSKILYEVEDKNMEDFGYGAKAFTLSLLETSLKLAGDNIRAYHIATSLEVVRRILHNPSVPMPGVKDGLEAISEAGRFRMIVITKGDILDQEHKLNRSGLGKYFERVDVVSKKGEQEYKSICDSMGIAYDELLMVGNSFKSDIIPVLNIGGSCIYIPYDFTWAHEITDEYSHPNLLKVNCFSDLVPYFV